MQIALFGDPIDRFFLTLENPPEELEMVVTEELYAVALQSRKYAGEPCDYVLLDYQPERQMETSKTDYARGYSDGYAGDKDANLFRESRNRDYQDGYTDGKRRRLYEHRDNSTSIVDTAGQGNYSRRGRVGAA